MKNIPHQFNDLDKFFRALVVAEKLIRNQSPLSDENYGEQLTREGIYTYLDKTLSVDEFLADQKEKKKSNRGYLTVARETRRFFELLGLITVSFGQTTEITPMGNQLLQTTSENIRKELWKNAFLQLGILGTDGEVSHPYRILLRLIRTFPGIETAKLMLALEAENDSEEEFERISNLAQKTIDQIIADTGTTESMAANAVKILPGIAEQLGDIERVNNRAYSVGNLLITEDEIVTAEYLPSKVKTDYWETSPEGIAKTPNLQDIFSKNIDIAEAIRTRQSRLADHQKIVKLLAELNAKHEFKLYEGRLDCLAIKGDKALLYEVKTIFLTKSDEEKQAVKGVGQLMYYKFSIVHKKMGYTKIKEVLVFSSKPDIAIVEFCAAEDILVVWRVDNEFCVFNTQTESDEIFNPDRFI